MRRSALRRYRQIDRFRFVGFDGRRGGISGLCRRGWRGGIGGPGCRGWRGGIGGPGCRSWRGGIGGPGRCGGRRRFRWRSRCGRREIGRSRRFSRHGLGRRGGDGWLIRSGGLGGRMVSRGRRSMPAMGAGAGGNRRGVLLLRFRGIAGREQRVCRYAIRNEPKQQRQSGPQFGASGQADAESAQQNKQRSFFHANASLFLRRIASCPAQEGPRRAAKDRKRIGNHCRFTFARRAYEMAR